MRKFSPLESPGMKSLRRDKVYFYSLGIDKNVFSSFSFKLTPFLETIWVISKSLKFLFIDSLVDCIDTSITKLFLLKILKFYW